MQITISVLGRFHAFYLASTLEQKGALKQLITSYPAFEVSRYGVPSPRLTTFPGVELLKRAWEHWPNRPKSWNGQDFFCQLFDRLAAGALREGADTLVAWSGSALETLRRGKRMGMMTVVERGSSHILFQQQILEEEYARHGLKFIETHPAVLQRELEEYEEAQLISIPSQFVKRTFIERGISQEKLLQTPYGVNLSEFTPGEKTDSLFRVLYCSTLSLRKGTLYLLKAFSELKLSQAELLLVGPVTPEISPLLRPYQNTPGIRFLGYQPQAKLVNYYRQASLFCLPSLEEGLAMVIAQAMACGVPALCTPNTGAEDLLNDGVEGWIIPIQDVEKLKEKILWAYEHQEESRAMGQNAWRRVSQAHSWEDYGKRIYQLYQDAAFPLIPGGQTSVTPNLSH